MSPCLGAAQIEELIAGMMSPRDAARAAEHLQACGGCAARREQMLTEADALFAELRAAFPAGRGLERPEPVCEPPAAAAIPGYEVLDEIHRGGQGVVYKAVQHGTQRVVALKVLLHGRFASPRQRQRFEREIELAASLDHPHIVPVFESGTTPDGRDYYAMAHVDGVALERHVQQARLDLAGTLRLFHKVCRAVHFAHQRGVIHRDLKPDNIRVDSAGEPHVLDFGLARPVDPWTGGEAVTEAGEFTGTLAYASPEQTAGDPLGVDIRSDVYSLGIMLYRVLTGRFPYRVSGAISQVLDDIRHTEPPPPSRHDPRIDDEVDTIILKAIAKDRERRYASAEALARDMERYLAGEPIDAKRDSAWYILRKTVRRYRWPLAAAAAVTLSLSAGLAAALHYGRVAAAQRDRARAAEDLARAEADKARRRFDDVRQLAHAFMFEFHDHIANLPGATMARQMLVSTALEYLDRLAREAGTLDDLRPDLAFAYERIGDVQGNPTMSNVGDPDGAMASYEKSLAFTEELAAERPHDRHWQWRLAVIHGRIGGVHASLRQPDRALDSYRRSLEFCAPLADEEPRHVEVLDHLSRTYERMGGTLGIMGRIEEAMTCHRQALAMAGQVAELDPGNVRHQLAPAICLGGLGELHRAAGHPYAALSCFEQSLRISRELGRQHRRHVEVERSLAAGLRRAGSVLRELGRVDEALACHRNSLARSMPLADGENAGGHARLAVALDHGQIAEVLETMGRGPEALQHYRTSQAILEGLAAADPDYTPARRHLAITLTRIASNLQSAGDSAGAAAHGRMAAELAAALAGGTPGDSAPQDH